MLKADLHTHTVYSPDCATSLENVIARCLEIGINCVAVTDHNTIAGALEVKRMAPFTVIVGEEIQTLSGEVIGYFLSEEIPSRLTAEKTARLIKQQGGLVCIPHPFDRLRPSTLRRQHLETLLPYIDIVEVFNSRVPLSRHSASALLFAQNHGLLASAGSDAHTAAEIGSAYVEMPEFNDREEFCLALAEGKVVGKRASPWVHARSMWVSLSNHVRER
ncbi:MAG: PHP-associated domain-containing protein [Dehalococcoidia bacterium]